MGKRLFLVLFFAICLALPAFAQSCSTNADCTPRGPGFECNSSSQCEWIPPIGIPRPEFGIEETYLMYQLGAGEDCSTNPEKCFDFGSGLESYRDAGNGPYTHYVDNSGECDDYGEASETDPLCRLPRSNMPAGSVVEVHGGPYSYTNGRVDLRSDGTSSRPVFVRGFDPQNRVEFQVGSLTLMGQYMIVENFYLYDAGISIRDPSGGAIHHISARNNEVEGNGTTSSGGGISAGSDTLTDYIVTYNNHVHHRGDYLYDGENDLMGTSAGRNSHYIWVVDNHIHHNGGDSFQSGHSAPAGSVSNIYVGRNEMHDDGENAVDIKGAVDVVVSQNLMYNYNIPDNTSADGVITVTHYGGTSISPERVWYLYNEMYNARRRGNQIGGSAGEGIYFIGNIVYDIGESAFDTHDSRDVYIVGNTMYDVGIGVDADGTAAYNATIVNNIFGRLNSPGTAPHIVAVNSVHRTNAIVSNNLFQDAMNVNTVCVDCVEGDPLFEDADNDNFRLLDRSPAAGAGIESSVYQTFWDLYYDDFDALGSLDTLDIRVDFDGNSLTGTRDIGAFKTEGVAVCIDTDTLLSFISQWVQGSMSMPSLISRIASWKAGTGCS